MAHVRAFGSEPCLWRWDGSVAVQGSMVWRSGKQATPHQRSNLHGDLGRLLPTKGFLSQRKLSSVMELPEDDGYRDSHHFEPWFTEQELEATIYRLRQENANLTSQVRGLQREIFSLQETMLASTEAMPGGTHPRHGIVDLRSELNVTRDALDALRSDRKRLKGEKVELVEQMKEIYSALEDKERELREFIRQYEQRMRDSDKGIKQLIIEKDTSENQKSMLESQLNETSCKISELQTSLFEKDEENGKLQQQLKELQGRFLLLTGQRPDTPIDSSRSEAPETTRKSTDISAHITSPCSGYSSMAMSPEQLIDGSTESDETELMNSALYRLNCSDAADPLSRSAIASPSTCKPQPMGQLRCASVGAPYSSPFETSTPLPVRRNDGHRSRSRSRRGHSSDSRPFSLRNWFSAFSKHRRNSSPYFDNDSPVAISSPSIPPMTDLEAAISADLNKAEMADALLSARQIPIASWKQHHVLAWLQLELEMSPYILAFSNHVKSGKVLMSLSDHDIESTLRITNSLHKRKFKLAIEEYRAPALCKYPCIREITSTWVCESWLPSIGLGQYRDTFAHGLIDGRLLNQLTKRQLDRQLGVTRRFHQISILKGVDLLRKFNFDLKPLVKRRSECDRENKDILVWTNQRFSRWARQVDLQEYAENLECSGVHGAVAVFEPSFSCDTLATALGVPPKCYMVRKHISTEFSSLLFEARSTMEPDFIPTSNRKRGGGSLGRSFTRSQTTSALMSHSEKPKVGIRGSFGRVFGLRMRKGSADISSLDGEQVVAVPALPTGAIPTSPTLGNVTERQSKQNTSSLSSNGSGSSTTSDLGSSIERTQHLQTILGSAPQVLRQAPVTGNRDRRSRILTNGSANIALSRSADSAISAALSPSDTENGPRLSDPATSARSDGSKSPNPLTSSTNHTSKIGSVRLRDKGGMSGSPVIRPHSVAEYSPSHANPGFFVPPSVVTEKICYGQREYQGVAYKSPDRLHRCASASEVIDNDFGVFSGHHATLHITGLDTANVILTPPPKMERRIVTISESRELDVGQCEKLEPEGSPVSRMCRSRTTVGPLSGVKSPRDSCSKDLPPPSPKGVVFRNPPHVFARPRSLRIGGEGSRSPFLSGIKGSRDASHSMYETDL